VNDERPDHARSNWWAKWRPSGVSVLIASAVVLAVGLLAGVLYLTFAGGNAEADKNSIGQLAVQNANSTQALCDGSNRDVAQALRDANLCEGAAAIKSQAVDAGVPTAVTVTAAVDTDQLLRFVRAEVVNYCAGADVCRPDASVLVPIVTDFLRKHPAQPGRPPTATEVRAAASAVIKADPTLFKGDPGVKGDRGADGANATDDQVAAAVAAYCGARDECAGTQGPPGISVGDVTFERNDAGQCESVVPLIDPRDGTTRVVRHAAGDAACPAIVVTTTEDPPLLGGR
jgi:hypothetical protein